MAIFKYPILTVATSLLCVLAFAPSIHAAVFDPKDGDKTHLVKTSIVEIDLGKVEPTMVAFKLINAALSLLAALCMALLIYAGFLWVWARGNEEEVTKAKDIIRGTVLGLIVVLASLGITTFVFKTVADISGAQLGP